MLLCFLTDVANSETQASKKLDSTSWSCSFALTIQFFRHDLNTPLVTTQP